MRKVKNEIMTNLWSLSRELYLMEIETKDRETRDLLYRTRIQIDKAILVLEANESEMSKSQISEFIRTIPMIHRIIEMVLELKDTLLFYNLTRNTINGLKDQSWKPPPGGSHALRV